MKSNITICLDHDVRIKFKEHCENTEQKMSGVIESLIVEHLEKNDSPACSCKNETGDATCNEVSK